APLHVAVGPHGPPSWRGSQDTPFTVVSSEVAVSSGGRSTPQKSTIAGSPHACTSGDDGRVGRSPRPASRGGRGPDRSPHATDCAAAGCGRAIWTGPFARIARKASTPPAMVTAAAPATPQWSSERLRASALAPAFGDGAVKDEPPGTSGSWGSRRWLPP